MLTAKLDDAIVTQFQLDSSNAPAAGFAAIGTGGFGYADYDDLTIST